MSDNVCGPRVCLLCLSGYGKLKPEITRLSYTWINQDRKSVQLPAPTYIDYVMTWVQNLLDDEATFPTKSGTFSNCFGPLRTSNIARQVMTSHHPSLQRSSTSIANCFASLPTFTTHTTRKSFTCVPNRTSTRYSRISSLSAASTSSLTSRTSGEHRARPQSVLARFGNAGGRWAYSRARSNEEEPYFWFKYTYYLRLLIFYGILYLCPLCFTTSKYIDRIRHTLRVVLVHSN